MEWELVTVSVVSTRDTGFEWSVTFTGSQKLLVECLERQVEAAGGEVHMTARLECALRRT
jgi:hypothetical protein